MKRVLLAATIGALLFAQHSSVRLHAQTGNGFQFFKNFFVTGDYAIAGVGLRNAPLVNGLATRTIQFSPGQIPANADVLGVFLYWQSVVATPDLDQAAEGVTFNGTLIGGTPEDAIAKLVSNPGTSPCWSGGGATGETGGGRTLAVFRVDVLRFITDLKSNGRLDLDRPFQIQVPSGGSGNSLPLAVGASLVAIFREAIPSRPLKAITIYDGGFTMDQADDRFELSLDGFYQPATIGAVGRLTPIVGDGQLNFSEKVAVMPLDGTQTVIPGATVAAVNPFASAQGANWDNPPLLGADAWNRQIDQTRRKPGGAEFFRLPVVRRGRRQYRSTGHGQ